MVLGSGKHTLGAPDQTKKALDQTKIDEGVSWPKGKWKEISAAIHAMGRVEETENTCQTNGKDDTKRESDFFTMFEVAAGLHAEYTHVECITRTLQSSHKHEHVHACWWLKMS